MKQLFLFFACIVLSVQECCSQELRAKVAINTQQVQGKTEACEVMRQKAEDFLNSHQWTGQKYMEQERIDCSFSITVNKYSEQDGAYECSMTLTASRPVWGTAYQSVLYSCKDNSFNFKFDAADQLEYNPDNLNNQLVALLAYYAHMLVGMDMDSYSLFGGTDVLKTAADIVTKAQDLGYAGWSAFNDNSNRYALLNDYIDPSMESMRRLTYNYHRKGMDLLADSAEVAERNLFDTIELLDEARQGRTMSIVPQLFAEYKKTELVNIFAGKGSNEQRKRIYDILFALNPSMVNEWEKIKK